MECKLRRVRSCLVMEVREVSADDLEWKRQELVKAWGSTLVARQGTVIDALTLDGYAAIDGGTKVGLLTYDFKDDAVEVVTIHLEPEGRGIGSALRWTRSKLEPKSSAPTDFGCRPPMTMSALSASTSSGVSTSRWSVAGFMDLVR